eukprot:COSAG02_NODE_6332_length_3645_cov_3.053582_1_plen_590_part_10
MLKSHGIGKGDRVAVYMPMVLELPIAMLACARIGAMHSVVFGGFSAEALAQRIVHSGSKILVTADGVMRATKFVELKSIADDGMALAAAEGNPIEKCIVYERKPSGMPAEGVPMQAGRDLSWATEMSKASAECDVEWMDAEDPLFMLYTSGSTGTPKGVLHTTGGYMVYAASTFQTVFDYQPGDVYWCTADCGWITGHTYIAYGPLLCGATQIVFEGVPNHPTNTRLWEIVDKHQVTQLYTAPTALRALMRFGDEPVLEFDLSSLRVLGSVGEPINPEAWRWYYEVVGKSNCPIVDTWWQTETGGIMLTPQPHKWELKPGSATFPFYGANMDPTSSEWDLPLLVRAAQGKPIERLPVWLMRQAGRYLPEYHQRRKGPDGNTVDFFDAIRDQEMAADLTVQPVTRFGVDAAIVYSDILIIPQAMNCKVEMVPVCRCFRPIPAVRPYHCTHSPLHAHFRGCAGQRRGEEGDAAWCGGAGSDRPRRQGRSAEPGADAPELPQSAGLARRPRRTRLLARYRGHPRLRLQHRAPHARAAQRGWESRRGRDRLHWWPMDAHDLHGWRNERGRRRSVCQGEEMAVQLSGGLEAAAGR